MLRNMREEVKQAKEERRRQLGPDGLADKNTRELQRIERKRRIAENYQKERASSTSSMMRLDPFDQVDLKGIRPVDSPSKMAVFMNKEEAKPNEFVAKS